MNSVITDGFLQKLRRLPDSVRQHASQAYALWRSDPHHPSLQFKQVNQRQEVFPVRVGLGHRALGLRQAETITWFWISSHPDYDSLLARLK